MSVAPVTLGMARAQCQIHPSDTTFDAVLTRYIPAAVELIEGRSGHALEPRQVTEYCAGFGCYLELKRRPVISVDTITYVDANGADATFSAFRARRGINPVRVYPAVNAAWPASVLATEAVAVTYTVGYESDAYPEKLVLAALLLIAHWFANREAVVIGDVSNEVELGIDALCENFRPLF